MDEQDLNSCPKCWGEGQVANSDQQEPWSVWEDLPPGSDLAVQLGVVQPIDCPTCLGSGLETSTPAQHAVQLLEEVTEGEDRPLTREDFGRMVATLVDDAGEEVTEGALQRWDMQCQRYVDSVGWHGWIEPTDEQRLRARRAARLLGYREERLAQADDHVWPPAPGTAHPALAEYADKVRNSMAAGCRQIDLQTAPTHRVVLTVRKAWGHAPYVGDPFAYVWLVAIDPAKRHIAGDARGVKLDTIP